MANISLTRVNQKLVQARVLLEGTEAGLLTPVHQNSLKEAIGFHLVCAYSHYLREIAEIYGLKHTEGIVSESTLSEAFRAASKHPAEAEELMALRGDGNSWLSQLHGYYQTLWSVPVPTAAVAADSQREQSDGIITLVNIDPAPATAEVDLALLARWHGEFVALVKRQRETSAEF